MSGEEAVEVAGAVVDVVNQTSDPSEAAEAAAETVVVEEEAEQEIKTKAPSPPTKGPDMLTPLLLRPARPIGPLASLRPTAGSHTPAPGNNTFSQNGVLASLQPSKM